MSRAFVKEDAPSEDVFVPPRAPLPPDRPNYVTPRGLSLLKNEAAELQARRAELKNAQAEREHARLLAVLDRQLDALQERLISAEVKPLPDPLPDKVSFGSDVTVRVLNGKFVGEERRFRIVGVDEAGDNEALVAFTAPIARALLGRSLGEQVELKVARQTQRLEVIALEHSDA